MSDQDIRLQVMLKMLEIEGTAYGPDLAIGSTHAVVQYILTGVVPTPQGLQEASK